MIDKDKIKQLVDKYYSLEKDGKLKDYNEAATKTGFIEPLFRALGWDIENLNDVSVEETISKKRVDYEFRTDGIPKFFLEAKALKEEDIIQLKYVQQAIDYAWMKSCTWAILTNFRMLILYNAEQENPDPRMNWFIKFTDPKEYLERYDQLVLLSKESIEARELDREAEKYGKKELKKPVDKALLDDITNFREIIYNNIKRDNTDKELTDSDIEEAVQRIIDRMIFIRSAEDRNLEPEELRSKVREWSNTSKNKLLAELSYLYKQYDENYNSKLFAHHLCDDLKIDDDVLSTVINGLYESKGGLYRYDFSLISADILGNIYEQYLGRILKKVGKISKLEASKAKRKSEGIYYTPTHIVDYIVKNTVGEYIKTHKEKDIENIKILDPACGSGSFLLKAYDTLENYWKEKGKLDETKLEDSGSYSKKVEIVTKNIFGVDLDEKAVEIAQLNLLLKIAEKHKRLPKLQQNIKNGNSVIDNEKVSNKAFNWNKEFAEIMKDGGFDIVIGNPPWVFTRDVDFQKEMKEYVQKMYFSGLESISKSHARQSGKINLYALFIIRAIRLLKGGGVFGFIIPNNILRTTTYDIIRKFILENCKILQIVDLGPNIFKNVTASTIILILQKEQNSKERLKNKIGIISDVRDLERKLYNTHKITQEIFTSNVSYAFSIISNKEDDSLLKKIEKAEEILGNVTTIHAGGIATGTNKNEMIADYPKNPRYKPLLEGKDIKPFYPEFSNKYILYERDKLRRPRDESIFLSQEKLVTQRIGGGIRVLVVSYDDKKYYTFNSTNTILLKNIDYPLKYLVALLNSKLLNYYYVNKFTNKSTLTVNISKTFLEKLPIKKATKQQDKIIKLVDKLLTLLKQIDRGKTVERNIVIRDEVAKITNEIDEIIYDLYNLTREERETINNFFK